MFLVFTVLNEVAKVMFLHVSVILSTGGVPAPGGRCSWSKGGVSALGGVPGPRGVPGLGGVPGPRGVCSWGVVSQHALRQTPSGETATAVDGTHPTGMHSC